MRRFLSQAGDSQGLTPSMWVKQTEPLMRQLRKHMAPVSTEAILDAIDTDDRERTRDMLGLND